MSKGVYVSNETNTNVEFDNLQIDHQSNCLIETNDYYPYGLLLPRSTALDVSPQDYKYNGKELQRDLQFNVEDYGARQYDPVVGRWLQVDPLAEVNPSFTPYHYCSNNPVNRTDPTGMLDDAIYVNNNTQQVSVIKTNDNYDRVIVDGIYSGNTEKGEYKSTYDGYNTNELKINYSSSANKSTVSDYTTSVLVDVMNQSGESSIQINSTARSVEDQVRVMGNMVESRGMDAQKKMYAAAGDKVLDKYPDRAAMLKTAKAVGPSNVSKHCADLNKMNVVGKHPTKYILI